MAKLLTGKSDILSILQRQFKETLIGPGTISVNSSTDNNRVNGVSSVPSISSSSLIGTNGQTLLYFIYGISTYGGNDILAEADQPRVGRKRYFLELK